MIVLSHVLQLCHLLAQKPTIQEDLYIYSVYYIYIYNHSVNIHQAEGPNQFKVSCLRIAVWKSRTAFWLSSGPLHVSTNMHIWGACNPDLVLKWSVPLQLKHLKPLQSLPCLLPSTVEVPSKRKTRQARRAMMAKSTPGLVNLGPQELWLLPCEVSKPGVPAKEVQTGPSGHCHPHPLGLCIPKNLQKKRSKCKLKCTTKHFRPPKMQSKNEDL